MAAILLLGACGQPRESDTPGLVLTSIKGTRDGDRLDVQAFYQAPAGDLKLDLHFAIGVPTKLRAGTWAGPNENGVVKEISTTFLGGQDGPPSIGGRFELLGTDNARRYVVSIPLQPLKTKL